MSIALLFSGQGAQRVGMGLQAYEQSDQARELYEQADAILGWELSKACFEGPEEFLTQTKVCQPALFVHCSVLHRLLKDHEALVDAAFAMGLSLGEITALTAAGAFDFETGLKVVAERGRLMQEACEQSNGSMASVIGVDRETVAAFCEEMDVEMANLNCPGQIVISGAADKIEAAVAAGKEKGFKRVIPLKVAGAYHSRLMEPAREAFAAFLDTVTFAEPKLTVLTNTTGKAVSDPSAIKEALIKQVVSPVLWEDCLREAVNLGATKFVELGVEGGVLRGMVKRTNREWEHTGYETWNDVQEA